LLNVARLPGSASVFSRKHFHVINNVFINNSYKKIEIVNTTISYIPNSDADRGIWSSNFSTKIGTYAAVVGITSAEVASVQKDIAMFIYMLNMQEAYKQTLNNITAYKSLLKHAVARQHLGAIPTPPILATPPAAVPEGVFDRISKLVKRIKASTSYTDAMGQDLGIVAPIQRTDVNSLQPDLMVKLDAGRPHIKCAKGVADAIDLYVDRKDGAGVILIGRLLKTDYMDTTNLPANTMLAEWDYKAMFVIGNDPVGLMSPVVSIIVKKL
jgi:hypothetical protein